MIDKLFLILSLVAESPANVLDNVVRDGDDFCRHGIHPLASGVWIRIDGVIMPHVVCVVSCALFGVHVRVRVGSTLLPPLEYHYHSVNHDRYASGILPAYFRHAIKPKMASRL